MPDRRVPPPRRRPRRETPRENMFKEDVPPKDPRQVAAVLERFKADPGGDPLKRLRMSGVDPKTDLKAQTLRGWDLYKLDFSGANLAGADLRQSDLGRCDLIDADLTGARLAHTRLEDANLTGARVAGADFRHANLRGCDLEDVDLSEAALDGACLLGGRIGDAKFGEDTELLADLMAEPARVLDAWPEMDRAEAADALGPKSRRILIDSFIHALNHGVLLKNCGIDPAELDSYRFESLFRAVFVNTNAQLFKALDPIRRQVIVDRRDAMKARDRETVAEQNRLLGCFHLLGRGFDEAYENMRDAHAAFREMGRPDRTAEMEALLGALYVERIDHLGAVRSFKHALASHEKAGGAEGQASLYLSLCVLALLHGELPRVHEFLDKAMRVQVGEGDIHLNVRRQTVAGCIAYRAGDADAACAHWKRAVDGLERLKAPSDAVLVLRLIEIARLDLALSGE